MSVLSIAPAPVGQLTPEGARLLTNQIRGKLASAWDLMQRAIVCEAWRLLDYDSPDQWLQEEFGDLRLIRISAEQRQDLVGALRSQGMSYRRISRALGVSVSTVHTDAAPAPVTRLRPEPVAVDEPVLPKTDRVVNLISEQGSKGLTCLELELTTGWGHGAASGALSRVAKQRRVTATGAFRLGYGVYATR